MADGNYLREYAVFSTRKLDSGRLPPRCTVCGANPSLFEYQKHTGSHPVREESGTCCTACGFNMLLQLAQDEASEWTALANT